MFLICALGLLQSPVGAFPPDPPAAKNLCPNGDLEKGTWFPEEWDYMDGLTLFWVKDEKRGGKCVRAETDVLRNEWEDRRKEMLAWAEKAGDLQKATPPKARARTPTKGPGYDTVGGVDGVHFNSPYIPVKPGQWYEVSVDVRVDPNPRFPGAKFEPKIFIKGYADIADVSGVARPRQAYKIFKDCAGTTAEWKTYTMKFNPTRKTPKVTRIKVNCYAYWHPGFYYFDNIRVCECAAPPDEGKEEGTGGK